jgi:DNA-binding LacI/PurR family transcriptional regulator
MVMRPFSAKSAVRQLADHLREEILSGALGENFPGINQLVRELGVGTETVVAAVAELEKEGLLKNRAGRRGRIVAGPGGAGTRRLRVRLLPYTREQCRLDYCLELEHRLEAAGHTVSFADKSLRDLRNEAGRVAGFVGKNPADAWVVIGGSREVLEWFSEQPVPAFALFGQPVGLSLAATGPRKSLCIQAAVRRLVELGHRRIAMLVYEERRKPQPGIPEQIFLDTLKAEGLSSGSYNLPDWRGGPGGFRECLNELFRFTPPTALFLEPELYSAAHQHFARHGILVPRDVSMISLDSAPLFDWWDPPTSHITYDSRPCIRRIVRWVSHVSCGIDDRRCTPTAARFVEGGTIGPAPREKTRLTGIK